MSKKKIDLVKLNPQELAELQIKIIDALNCKGNCDICPAQKSKYLINGKELEKGLFPCHEALSVVAKLLLVEASFENKLPKKAKKKSENKNESKCSDCKFCKKHGDFSFCENWHNFTENNGCCYRFENKEDVSKAVDK